MQDPQDLGSMVDYNWRRNKLYRDAQEAEKIGNWVHDRTRVFVITPLALASVLGMMALTTTWGPSGPMWSAVGIAVIAGLFLGIVGAALIHMVNTIRVRRFISLSKKAGDVVVPLDSVHAIPAWMSLALLAFGSIIVSIWVLAALPSMPEVPPSHGDADRPIEGRVRVDGTLHAFDSDAHPGISNVTIDIHYSWTWQGRTYESTTVESSGNDRISRAFYDSLLPYVATLGSVNVYIDPERPDRGTIIPPGQEHDRATEVDHYHQERYAKAFRSAKIRRRICFSVSAVTFVGFGIFATFAWITFHRPLFALEQEIEQRDN